MSLLALFPSAIMRATFAVGKRPGRESSTKTTNLSRSLLRNGVRTDHNMSCRIVTRPRSALFFEVACDDRGHRPRSMPLIGRLRERYPPVPANLRRSGPPPLQAVREIPNGGVLVKGKLPASCALNPCFLPCDGSRVAALCTLDAVHAKAPRVVAGLGLRPVSAGSGRARVGRQPPCQAQASRKSPSALCRMATSRQCPPPERRRMNMCSADSQLKW
jgi:hypothetical protein